MSSRKASRKSQKLSFFVNMADKQVRSTTKEMNELSIFIYYEKSGKYFLIRAQEFVSKSEIRLKSPKSPNSRSSSRRPNSRSSKTSNFGFSVFLTIFFYLNTNSCDQIPVTSQDGVSFNP